MIEVTWAFAKILLYRIWRGEERNRALWQKMSTWGDLLGGSADMLRTEFRVKMQFVQS